jgi:hypothetical protein
MHHTFTGYCGKNNQWVPVEGGGPLLYIENAILAGGSYSERSWSQLVEDYEKQHRQVLQGKRQVDSVYMPEVGDVMGKNSSQAKVCLVTAAMPATDEIEYVLGTSDNAAYVSREGKLVRRGDRFD